MKTLVAQRNESSVFNPLRFLGNAHIQTLLGNLLEGPYFAQPSKKHFVALPDGDRLVIHDSKSRWWRAGDPVAILVHGLGGCHLSPGVQRTARLLWPHGFRVVRVDLRGCGSGTALARKTYHGGCSDDLRAVVETVHGWSPKSPIDVVGFSLGGNIALKMAGEASAEPLPGLRRVAAIGPPIDFLRCIELLERPRNRLYELHYVRRQVQQAKAHQQLFPTLPRLKFTRSLTMRKFDDMYTAPVSGFRGAEDYYRRASAFHLVARIAVETLVITAKDDPFIAVEAFHDAPWSSMVDVRITERGGHLGFVGPGGERWAERRVVDWLIHG
jgi:predicted alpha/beta-fold hydrolase